MRETRAFARASLYFDQSNTIAALSRDGKCPDGRNDAHRRSRHHDHATPDHPSSGRKGPWPRQSQRHPPHRRRHQARDYRPQHRSPRRQPRPTRHHLPPGRPGQYRNPRRAGPPQNPSSLSCAYQAPILFCDDGNARREGAVPFIRFHGKILSSPRLAAPGQRRQSCFIAAKRGRRMLLHAAERFPILRVSPARSLCGNARPARHQGGRIMA